MYVDFMSNIETPGTENEMLESFNRKLTAAEPISQGRSDTGSVTW